MMIPMSRSFCEAIGHEDWLNVKYVRTAIRNRLQRFMVGVVVIVLWIMTNCLVRLMNNNNLNLINNRLLTATDDF